MTIAAETIDYTADLTPEDQDAAREVALLLLNKDVTLTITAPEGTARLTAGLTHYLHRALAGAALAGAGVGAAVVLRTFPEFITSAEAADLLGISRPALRQMVAAGEVPMERRDGRDVFRTTAMQAIAAERAAQREAALDALRDLEDADEG